MPAKNKWFHVIIPSIQSITTLLTLSSDHLKTLLRIPAFLICFIFSSHGLWGKVDFNREIRPILSDKCYKCHGPDAKNQKSDFRLDSFEEAIKEHNGFLGLSPGSLEDSEIHWRIHSDDPIDIMPPPDSKLPLTSKEKKLLDQWIKEGGEYEKHWSFQPLPLSVEIPKSDHPSPKNEIDHFIAHALSSSSLSPSAETDRATWLRRVTFDLTGLPPTLQSLDTFLSDSSKDAYEKVVTQLLGTDEYAERMTSEWLDVARYSDTYGYQVDRNRNVWQWRDWVIQSFRKNQPYNEFVTEQIAGDLIPGASRDQILATCFNRLHPQKVEGGSVPEEFRIEYVADRVHTFGTAFLGLSFECTRCHDHKYDPITQKDYFSLSAFFNNIDEAGLYSYMTPSVPTPTLELGNLPSDHAVKQAEADLQKTIKSEDYRKQAQRWLESIGRESMGHALYFSKDFPPNPAEPLDLLSYAPSLWLDANEPNATSTQWYDKSGNNNHATKHASPTVQTHKPSGLKVMKYQANKLDFHEFEEIKNIRTVFWVVSKTAGNSGSLLSHSSLYHFYSNGSKFWHPNHTHEHVKKGKLRINGIAGNENSVYPNSLAVVSLVTTGDVTANRLGRDRNHGGKHNWDGEVGELLVFSEPLAQADIEKIEKHLTQKWKINHKKKERYGPPLAYLSFDNRNGNQYPNSANPAKNASTNHNNKEVSGKFGKGIQFSGDDGMSFPAEFGNFTRHQTFSMAFWIKPTQLLDRAVVVKRSQAWTDAGSRGYEILIENGKLSPALVHFWPGNAIRVRSKHILPVNEWTHVALTYDGSSEARGLQLYENGNLAEIEIVRDHLTREITGGGSPFLAFAERMRDRGFKNGIIDEFFLYDRVIAPSEIGKLAGVTQKVNPEDEISIFFQAAHPESQAKFLGLEKARKAWGDKRQKLPEIMVMKEMPGLRETHILERGHYANRGQVVHRASPEVLPSLPEGTPLNRLGLAKWLTSSDHPLMARVSVNRYWQMIFGQGIVATSEDFGLQGKPPSHPTLLDWLARDLISSNWNMHHLLKKMVLSHTYRQKSKILPPMAETDPENILLSRAPTYTLPAEMIRDSLLAHSGLLHRKIGGPSAKPYDLKVSFKPINPDSAPNVYRRSVYTFWKRTAPTPVMMAMDASKRDVCTVRRERTSSPSQSLIMLNGTQFVEAARATADSLVQTHGNANPRPLIEEAFHNLTSRKPSPEENNILLRLLEEQQSYFTDSNNSKKFLEVGYHKPKSKDLNYLAAVTSLISALMNFDGTLSKR
ncbi:MAG: DUF1553 domain-containing protein [Opitutales bacterium]|nr:DUF1553 domain-containing protein [Opitutales bacterium]